MHCDKSLSEFRAIARSAAENKWYSTELSEVIQLNLGQLPAIARNTRRFNYFHLFLNIVIIFKYYYYIIII